MTVDQVKNVLEAQPFAPFTIHMGDGRTFLVKHRDFISRSPSGRTLIVHGDDDSFSILDLLLVTELEMQSTGKTRRRGIVNTYLLIRPQGIIFCARTGNPHDRS